MPIRAVSPLELIELGQRLRQLRRERKLTQEALAIKASIPTPRLRRWEYGVSAMSVPSLFRLARALGIPVSALVDGID